jgi:hypothetical protein
MFWWVYQPSSPRISVTPGFLNVGPSGVNCMHMRTLIPPQLQLHVKSAKRTMMSHGSVDTIYK